jgi:trigger factor
MGIQSVLKDVSAVQKKLSVEVTAEAAAKEFTRVLGDFKRKSSLPGFRRGRAPVNLVKNRFAKDIREEVIRCLVPESYQQAIKDKGMEPIRTPHVSELDFSEGQPLKYVAEFQIEPSFELPEYRGLKVIVDRPKDLEEMLEQRLKALQERGTSLKSVENRPVDMDDLAAIDLHGRFISPEGLPLVGLDPIEEENVLLEVGGENVHKSFSKALLGMNLKEEKVFQIAYEQDYPDKKMAGQRIEFTIQLNDLKQKEVPELDDDFAKNFGKWESFQELQEELRGEMAKEAERGAESSRRNGVVERLVNLTPFEVPGVLVEEVLDGKLRDFAVRVASQGVDPAKAGIDWASVRKDFQDVAEKEVRAHFVLEALVAKEVIEVHEAEVEAEVDRLASEVKKSREEVEEHLEELKASIRRRKAIELLLEDAEFEER